jgi:hypothetical protein
MLMTNKALSTSLWWLDFQLLPTPAAAAAAFTWLVGNDAGLPVVAVSNQ